jgi:hypothetical protein
MKKGEDDYVTVCVGMGKKWKKKRKWERVCVREEEAGAFALKKNVYTFPSISYAQPMIHNPWSMDPTHTLPISFGLGPNLPAASVLF